MPYGKLESRYTIPSGASVSLTQAGGGTPGPTSVSLTAGDYYLADLTAHVKTRLEALGGGSTYTVTTSDDTDTSTGKVTITKTSAGTFELTWTSTGIRDALGFTATLTPTASAFTSTNASPYIWLPNCGRSDGVLGDGDEGFPAKVAAVNVASSGATYSWVGAATRYESTLAFNDLKASKVLTSQESVANESLQVFWVNAIGLGKPFRWHKDRSVDATYVAYTANEEGVRTFRPERVIANMYGPNALFRWRTDVFKYTGA